mmetsp:Transcript_26665/g.62637  ORF Transcript_26665/g.62637 Transcript_26665/m.62637 type:complete len:310 (-) Transcript_26665:569-1498(-)
MVREKQTASRGSYLQMTGAASKRTRALRLSVASFFALFLLLPDPVAVPSLLPFVPVTGFVLATGTGARVARFRARSRYAPLRAQRALGRFDPLTASLRVSFVAPGGVVPASRRSVVPDEGSVAGSAGQRPRQHLGLFGHNRSLNVQRRAGLEGLELSQQVRIAEVARFLVGALGSVAEGQKVLAEEVRHGAGPFVFAPIQHILQDFLVPAAHIVGVVDARGVRKGVPSAVVGHDAEEQLDLGKLDGMRGRAVSVKFAVLRVRDVVGVIRRAVDADPVPAIRHPHGHLQFIALARGEKIVFRVAVAFVAG